VTALDGTSMVLEFDGVSFGFPGHGPVLDHFTLTIAAGEVLALVGRSGAGKSTVLKLANGLLAPQAGTVRVEGRSTGEWDAIRLRRRTGYVLQDVGLFPHMTLRQNIALVPSLEEWPADRIAARVSELLDLLGLPASSYGSRYPRELSGGQRQRVGVARALAADPPVLLMDEPFGALDPVTRAEMQREFLRIQQEVRKTVVIVTHDPAEAVALADRIGILHEGRLIACDTPAAVAASRDERVRPFLDVLRVAGGRPPGARSPGDSLARP
jgi:osmoprotectant transport system ATP-binding protein